MLVVLAIFGLLIALATIVLVDRNRDRTLDMSASIKVMGMEVTGSLSSHPTCHDRA